MWQEVRVKRLGELLNKVFDFENQPAGVSINKHGLYINSKGLHYIFHFKLPFWVQIHTPKFNLMFGYKSLKRIRTSLKPSFYFNTNFYK